MILGCVQNGAKVQIGPLAHLNYETATKVGIFFFNIYQNISISIHISKYLISQTAQIINEASRKILEFKNNILFQLTKTIYTYVMLMLKA